MGTYGIGQPVRRFEDDRFLRGLGRFCGDIALPRQAHLHILRSPHAAARIRSIDVEAAKAAAGIVGIFTGADAVAAGLGTLSSRAPRRRRDGSPNFVPPYRALALERVRHVGDPVVAIVAETIDAAKDAAELVEIDYEILPAVTSTGAASAPGAPAVWDEVPDNECFFFRQGDEAAVDAAFARAAHVASVELEISRVAANPMEPRGAIGSYDRADGRYTLYVTSQTPHQLRVELADRILHVPAHRIRVVAPDVGGGFGMKGSFYPEYPLVLWLSRELGRPVKWISERSEALIADHHARDNLWRVSLALDADGRFLALKTRSIANLGAYLAFNGAHVPVNNIGGVAGVYTTPLIHVAVSGIFSNTNPTAPYRGAGRPEASYAIERVIDAAAAEMGIDRVELRRRNLIPPDSMPYKTALTFTYDSGEFERNTDAVLKLADWDGFAARRREAESRGRLRGIGFANVIEIAGGPPDVPFEEAAEIRFDATGSATLLMGSHNHGQGHETVFRQVVAELLGLAPDLVRVDFGDTDRIPHGRGTFGSRSMSVAGAALAHAAEKVIAKGRAIAAYLLEAAEADLEFADGRFLVGGTDRGVDLVEVARIAYVPNRLPRGIEAGLVESAITVPPGPTYPNGCHVCEVEIDPDTGVTEIVRYAIVDDVGRVVNPLLLKGQIHGAVAQGVGQILSERIVYDGESGQMLSGSFMDYAMPRATDLPFFDVESNEVPAKTNPLGIKGAGEAGTVGALPAAASAIADALGVRHFDMPATPERVWRAIEAARRVKG